MHFFRVPERSSEATVHSDAFTLTTWIVILKHICYLLRGNDVGNNSIGKNKLPFFQQVEVKIVVISSLLADQENRRFKDYDKKKKIIKSLKQTIAEGLTKHCPEHTAFIFLILLFVKSSSVVDRLVYDQWQINYTQLYIYM